MDTLPDLAVLIRGVEADTPSAGAARVARAVLLTRELEGLGAALLGHFVAQAREGGVSWTQIGAELGVTRQAAQQRFGVNAETTRHLVTETDRGALEKEVLRRVMDLVARRGHAQIAPEHLLFGLCSTRRGEPALAAGVLSRLGLSPRPLETTVQAHLKTLASSGRRRWFRGGGGSASFSPQARRVLDDTRKKTLEFGLEDATPGIMLLALLAERESVAAAILRVYGADVDGLRATVSQQQA